MKKLFKDEHEKRAALLTALTVFIVFLWMFFHRAFEYQDPPIEYGMEVNFGTTDFGSGDNQSVEELKMQPVEEVTPQEPVEEPVDEQPVEETSEAQPEEATEELMTEDTAEEVPVVETSENTSEEPVEPVKEEPAEEPVKETPKEEPAEAPKEDPKPDQATEDALSNVLNGPPADGPSTNSEGDDNEDGDKGNDNGDPNAPDYYTNPGNGSGGNYQLIGRLPLRRITPDYTCGQEGRVVVAIKVNRDGKVISAVPGAKGSTTTDTCLLNKAKEAALKTKWQSAPNAPEKQVGKIIYNFSKY